MRQSKGIEIYATGGDDKKVEMARLMEYSEESFHGNQNTGVVS
jgi:hypothetical protein